MGIHRPLGRFAGTHPATETKAEAAHFRRDDAGTMVERRRGGTTSDTCAPCLSGDIR